MRFVKLKHKSGGIRYVNPKSILFIGEEWKKAFIVFGPNHYIDMADSAAEVMRKIRGVIREEKNEEAK